MSGYTDTIRRWAIDTRRAGSLQDADGTGELGLGSDESGRRLAVRFGVKVDGDRIDAVGFEVFGCGFTIAACAAAADLVEGLSLKDALAIGKNDIEVALEGLPVEREYCAGLAAEALQAALESARNQTRSVQVAFDPASEHGTAGSTDDPVYSTLMNTAAPAGARGEDRHLFACLLSASARDPHAFESGLGLDTVEIDGILAAYFPGTDRSLLYEHGEAESTPPPDRNDDVLNLLLSHVPTDEAGDPTRPSLWLAHAIAARAAHPGHLWTAMGLFERPELTAAIRRHLPSLAAANHKEMRWKRYLFKRVCDLGGGVMCKAPDCGVCSDYAFCFGD